MDLKGNKIKLGDVMKNKAAAALLRRSFPEWASSPLLLVASNMTLDDLLKVAEKRVPKEKVASVLKALESL